MTVLVLTLGVGLVKYCDLAAVLGGEIADRALEGVAVGLKKGALPPQP